MFPKKAATYIAAVIALGGIAGAAAFLVRGWNANANEAVAVLAMTVLAVLSQLGKTVFSGAGGAGKGTSWYTPLLSIVFASALALSPQSIAIVVITPHLIEWLIERMRKTPFLSKWYIQPFNLATHLLCSLASWGAFAGARGPLTLPVAAILAAVVYLFANHFLVGQVLVWARGMTWAQSGVWQAANLLCDGVFLIAGMAAALLMSVNLLLAVPVVLLLIGGQRLVARALVRPSAVCAA